MVRNALRLNTEIGTTEGAAQQDVIRRAVMSGTLTYEAIQDYLASLNTTTEQDVLRDGGAPWEDGDARPWDSIYNMP